MVDAEKETHAVEEQSATLHGTLIEGTASIVDDLLIEKLERAFHKPTSQVMVHDLAKIASEHDPIDLAHAASRLPMSTRAVLYDNLPDFQAKIIFMINTGSNTRTAIFRQVPDREIVELLEAVPPDEAVWMLDDMSDRRLKRVFDQLNPKKAHQIRELFKHDRESAGRLMTNEFFAFHMNVTIGEVAAKIRDNPGIDLTRRIFVLNDFGQLAGFIPDRNLIINPSNLPIRQVMQPVLQKVSPDTTRDVVVDLMERYEIPALPVVDQAEHLVGVISYEDAVEALKDILDDTIASIGGTAEDVSEHEPIFKRFFWRAPWLIITLGAGLVTATGISFIRAKPWYLLVSSFVQLIAGFSGNVGIQCSTLMVRSISSGELTLRNRGETIFKELLMGMLIGSTFGLFCGLIIFLLSTSGIYQIGEDPFAIGTIICFGVFGACITATCLGTLSPFIFSRLGVDPAVASGPIVTAFNDVLSTWVFFLVASTVSALVYR